MQIKTVILVTSQKM